MPSSFSALNVPLVPLPEGSAVFEGGAHVALLTAAFAALPLCRPTPDFIGQNRCNNGTHTVFRRRCTGNALAYCWLRSFSLRPRHASQQSLWSCSSCPAHSHRRGAGDEAEAAHSSGYDAFARSGEGSDEAPSTSYHSDDVDERFPSAAGIGRSRSLWQALQGVLHLGHDAESAVRTTSL